MENIENINFWRKGGIVKKQILALGCLLCLLSPIYGVSLWESTMTSLNPTAWWRLNETSGGVALDATGNGFNGAYQFSPVLGQSAAFDGPDNKAVNFANGVADMGDVLDPENRSFTMLSWFRKTSPSTGLMKIINKGRTSAGTPPETGYQIRIRDNTIETTISDNSANVVTINTAEPTLNDYHFVVTVVDRNTNQIQMYLDPTGGIVAAQASIASIGAVNTNIPFAIGALDRGGAGVTSEFFGGEIDEVAFFDGVALSGTQVQQLFDSVNLEANAVPEPSSFLLGIFALSFLWMIKQKN